mmetsp:Transcript_32482/g.39981  ORF Transcript_32482/g.39981 Transcript_32482/m.39981 type:complete len:614 (+) Transcript_32482:203-2044(+)|eukprot:CAMPEP_0204834284 /NCGR_PEP_ID=MMETSP1346-20131115/19429_1 /ASSEMBLY_ACC=CAM_ASM_000771 /TAXON_ID=215587 /ORGANISM="Aplanochytrium stocchinoi, Strain GSBS06" /LENGTH=613 /DNA_ID=CAMNT_0051967509 /DNA_START=119 /DNA_END=1960 /DNA_ORIENTATION=-
MATSHAAIEGSNESLRKVARALLSVSDKTDIVKFGTFLAGKGVELLSTGGTAKTLREAGLTVKDVSDHTGSPEMLDGRVKTLHPKIHGGILAVRGNSKHEEDMKVNEIAPIDMVILNLYPFEQTVSKGSDFDMCVENVDIGGPGMLRASAKNHKAVVIVTSPSQYQSVMDEMEANDACTTIELRRKFAAAAFALSAHYDGAIASYFSKQLATALPSVTRTYVPERKLKYGCNPNQQPAALCKLGEKELPFVVKNGNPGYINLLDAANAWQLVRELRIATNLPAAASFKHVSPAGAAVAVPLSEVESEAYEMHTRKIELTPSALAYLRARQADPMSSFGDFAALSDHVDVETAKVLKTEVSDGIVAPSYAPEALEILSAKKGGNFIVLQADPNYSAPENEYREVFGMGFMQKRNDIILTEETLAKVVTKENTLSESAKRDLLVGSISLKYTQSNSVGYAINGQMVGVGAGQQSRVDCAKLAGRKVKIWYLRQHPKVLGMKFKSGIKRQARINARVRYIEGDFSEIERKTWETQFDEIPEPLTEAEKNDFMASLSGVALSSDAFFPFRDSIDVASKLGVSYVAQAGGSVQDPQIIEACDEYKMAMAMTGQRLFHH